MKIEDANARLGQDMREAQAQGDTDAVAIIATAMLIYDVPMNLDQFISEIEQHINQHPASERVLSFALALSYTRKKDHRQELYMSDGTANPLIGVLESIIDTDKILQLPNLPEEFVREIQTEQQQAIKIVTDFTQKEAPHMPPTFFMLLHLEPGKQAQKLLAMLKPMLEPSGKSTPKVPKVEELSAPTEQKSSRAEQPAAKTRPETEEALRRRRAEKEKKEHQNRKKVFLILFIIALLVIFLIWPFIF